MEELKHCPFCGAEAWKGTNIQNNHCVECANCDASTAWYETEQEAIEAWNKRTNVKGD